LVKVVNKAARLKMSDDIAAASSIANGYLKTWDEGGRLQWQVISRVDTLQLTLVNSLDHLRTLSGQPGITDDVRAIFQCLVNALIKTDGFRLPPDDLASLYTDLVLSQPSSSSNPVHLAIHQTLLDSISVVDDVLEDRAMAREVLLKEKEKDASQQKEKPRHRVIPERQPLVDLLRRLIVSLITALVSLLLNPVLTGKQHTFSGILCTQPGLWTIARRGASPRLRSN
jgi:hypothetical protein